MQSFRGSRLARDLPYVVPFGKLGLGFGLGAVVGLVHDTVIPSVSFRSSASDGRSAHRHDSDPYPVTR